MDSRTLGRKLARAVCPLVLSAAAAPGCADSLPPARSEPAADASIRDQCRASGCEIELVRVATLSDSAAPGLFGNRIFLETDRSGNFITTTLGSDGFAVFDPDGTWTGTFGRAGDGPGEYRRALAPIRGPADSLYIFDALAARLTVLDPDHSYARSMPFPGQPGMVLEDGTFVIIGQLRSAEGLGYPIHLIDAEGGFVSSFGTESPQYRADMSRILSRVGGRGSDGTLWTVPPGRFAIEQWDLARAERVRALDAQPPDWFRESMAPSGSARVVEPDPVITQLWEGDDGLLWMMATVPDAEWEPTDAESQHGPMPTEDRNRMYDWRIEVLDPDTGESVASQVVPEELWIRAPYEFFISPAGLRGDAVLFDVLRAELRPAGPYGTPARRP